jgi:hypothetical protein
MKGQTYRLGQVILAGFVFLITLGLLLLFGQALTTRVIEALQYLFWLAGSTLRSVDQDVLWIIMILIFALVLGAAALRKLLPSLAAGEEQGTPEWENPGRLQFWLKQTRRASGHFIQESYALIEFRRLALAVLAYRTHLSEDEVEARLRAGELEVPAEVARLFSRGRRSQEQGGLRRWMARQWTFMAAALSGKKKTGFAQGDTRLAGLAQFLESQLEIKHDH